MRGWCDMTVQELAERDLKKAEINLFHAKKRPNISPGEVAHHEELFKLRKDILEMIKERNAL